MSAHIYDAAELGPRWTTRPSGLWVPAEPRRPVAVDLFAGSGGFSLGVIQAGFRVAAAVEWDAAAAATYCVNLGSYPIQFYFGGDEDRARLERFLNPPKSGKGVRQALVSGSNRPPDIPGVDHFFFCDARKLTGAQILAAIGLQRGELDLVVGGPPCQGFSTSGKRNVMDPRNSLVFEFARLVCEMHPKTMVFENVPGIQMMVTPEGLPVVDALCRVLEDGGMGTFDGLRKVLGAHSNARAIVRTRTTGKATLEEPDEKEDGPEQLAFGF